MYRITERIKGNKLDYQVQKRVLFFWYSPFGVACHFSTIERAQGLIRSLSIGESKTVYKYKGRSMLEKALNFVVENNK